MSSKVPSIGKWDHGDYPKGGARVPDLTYGKRDCCSAEWDWGWGSGLAWACTRRSGHTGRHAAGTGNIIVAVWGD